MKHWITATLILGAAAAVGCNTTAEDTYEPEEGYEYEFVEADQQVSFNVTGMT